ncbi:hypothetical protein F4825DRAFT_286297 [Nemania diffusa]|nr:hypothetical protein F4825DRAFT_286297 [Nemania diffusa]
MEEDILMVFDKIFDPCEVWTTVPDPSVKGFRNVEDFRSAYSEHLSAHWRRTLHPGEMLSALRPPSPDDNEGIARFYPTDELPPCFDPCFFITADKYHGLCHWTAKEGDTIVLLYGGNVPYLLRPIDKNECAKYGGDNDSALFKLVGECYVEGIMYGDFLGKEKGVNIREGETRTCTLV